MKTNRTKMTFIISKAIIQINYHQTDIHHIQSIHGDISKPCITLVNFYFEQKQLFLLN